MLAISESIHAEKYRVNGESFEQAMNRVAAALSDGDDHRKKVRDILLERRFLPAGRVQSAMGAPRRVTPYNCFVSQTIHDSMDGIMDSASKAAQTLRLGGGIGYDFSTLRPRNDLIKSLNSSSSGPVSFMGVYDAICKTISSAGHRRGAQMGVLRVDHPDIMEFIHAKQNRDNLTQFNVSVACTDVFMQAVKDGTMYNLLFEGEVYGTLDARNVWEEIMRSTWDWAEPGVLFIDTINKKNNLWYCETIAASNPCVTGDTLVGTPNGIFPVSEIKPGQIINTVMGDHPVTTIETHENVPVFLVKLSDGTEIKATAAHIFHVQEGKYFNTNTRLDQLNIGDRIRLAPMVRTPSGTKDDWNLGFLMGVSIGDGCMTDKSRQLKIACRKDEPDWIATLQQTISFVGNVTVTDSTAECVTVNTTDGLKFLDFHGLGRGKSYEKTITLNMLNKSTEFLRGYIDGMISTDGNVHMSKTNPMVRVTSTNKESLMMLKRALSVFGILARIYVDDKPEGTIQGRAIARNHTTYTLVILGSGLKDLHIKIGITRPSRKDRLTQLVKHNSLTGCTWSAQVRSITPLGTEKVYDLFEQVTDTWITDGVVNRGCGEQPLPPNGACLLGSFNLTKYVTRDEKTGRRVLDAKKFMEDIPPIVRAMDNVVDRAIYPLDEQRLEAHNKRRMGLGFTGVANSIESLGCVYGSRRFIDHLDFMHKVLTETAYITSAELAREKGAFKLYDERYLTGNPDSFVQSLPDHIKNRIEECGGIRNSHLTSIAPTGTISLTADNVSSGIEPVFAHSFDRTIIRGNGDVTVETVEDYGVREFKVEGKTADECSPSDHLGVLLCSQSNVDSAVSKTCNIGEDVSWEDFKAVYTKAYYGGAKGCTTFRASGKRLGILNAKPKSEEEGACYYDPSTGLRSCE